MRVRPSILLVLLPLISCKKPLDDVMDYYPKVFTESVTAQPDGSVIAVGRITSEGDTPIEAVGFCASTSSNPGMLEAQALANLNGDRFTVTYSGFATVGTYYFRAWATNGNGYSLGGVLALSDIEIEPITPPCTPTLDYVSPGGGLATESYYPISTPTEYLGDWEFHANTSAHYFTYTFGSALITGIYTTTTNSNPTPGTVHISFLSGFTGGTLASGTSVYVNQLTPTSWEITLCQAPWGAGPYYLNTRFRVPS